MNSLSVKQLNAKSVRFDVMMNMLALLVIIAIGIIPILNKSLVNSYRLVFFFFWLFSIPFIGKISLKHSEAKIVIWWCLYLILQLIYSLIGISTDIMYFVGKVHIYMIPVAMVIVTKYYSLKEMKILWVATLAIFLACLFYNILIGLREGTYVFLDVEKQSNVGKTAFVAICQYIIVSSWVIFKKSRFKVFRIFCLAILAITAYHILFQNNRAITTLLLLLTAAGMCFISLSKFKKKISFIKIILGGVILLVLIFPLLSYLIQSLATSFSEITRLSTRLDDLSVLMSSGNIEEVDNGGSLYHRFLLWGTSINTFLSSISNFLFGIGESRFTSDMTFVLYSGVGFHSEFFDLAARYGIIGLCIFYFAIKYTFKYLIDLCYDAEIKNMLYIIIISMIVQMFVNNLFNNVGAIIIPLIFLPVSVVLLEYKKM